MVLGIRHLVGCLNNDAVFFSQNLHILGTICILRRLCGKAMLQDFSNDLTVPVYGVYKREGNLHTY